MQSLPTGWRVSNSSGSYSGPAKRDESTESDGDESSGEDDSIANSNEDVDNLGLDIRPDSPGWEDAEPDDEEPVHIKCLFCSSTFLAANEMLDHCTMGHGFDFLAVRTQHRLDFYSTIKFVNYLRANGIPNMTKAAMEPGLWADEKYLQPVLDNDALLFSLDELIDFPEEHTNGTAGNGENNASNTAQSSSK